MKLLAAFGLLAIAFAAWQPTERSFQSGNTYEFEWKGQIVSGIPVKGASSHSLQQIRSKIHLTVADKHSYIRLSDVRISNGHKQLTEPRYYSEGSSLEESQLSTEQREQLTYPVRFRYHKGIVSEIVFSEEESAWSENIKRAVLNMLQVQMTGTKSQDEYNKEKYDVETKNKFFIVPTERMLEGECEVAYTIVDSGRDEKEVTKSINFDKCSKRVDIRYGPRYSNECPMCDTADSRPESQTVMTYKIRGEEESFLISEVELKSEYIFTPFAKDKEMLATYVHQKMRLVKISSAERVSEPRNGKKSSLLYNYERELAREKFWMNGDESEYKLTGYEGIPKKELMDKYVRLAVKSMEETTVDGVTLDTNHNFARMVEIFRMCTERDIQEIHRHFWDAESFGTDVLPKVRHLLSDALIAAGTKNTIQHFIEKVEKNQMCPIRASLAIKGLTNIRIPSEKIISQLLALSKSRVCREQPILRQSVLLTVGALMNGLCNKNTPEQWAVQLKDQKECTRELKKEWMNEWEKLFSEGETRYEKVLVLKAVANSAIDVSIHFLEKVIYDRREPLVVRQAAVDALRMLRDQMPRKVQSVCLPLFKSRREPVPLRISALYQLVHSRPERALLDQIVHHLNYEPSVQLRSFGVSLLRSLAESKKNPCEEKLAEDIAVSLRMLRGAPLSVSTHVHLPWYSRALDLGYTMDLASIFSNNSFLPNELLASVDSLYAGQWYKHFLQVGVFQNNMDNVLIPLMEKLEKSESEIRVRGQRSQMAPLRETLKDMLRQMKIQARDNGYKSEESFGMLYIRHKNLDYAVVPMEQEILDKMIKDFSSYTTSEIVRQLTRGVRFEGVLSGFVYEYVRIVPTTFGLPLQVTNKMPTVGSVNGLIKVELGSKIALRVEMEPSFVSTHVHEMIVLAPEMHHGARVFHSAQVTLPINCNMEYSYEKNSIKANIRLPKEEKRVFLFESRPTTYVRTFSSKRSPVLDEKTVRIPSFEKTSVHYEQTYGEELFGLPIEVVGSVHRRFFEKPEVFLYGENHVQAILKPNGRNSLEAVEITIEPSYSKKSSSEFEEPRYDETFTDEEFRLETSDESVERPEERTQRRTHSKKHYESFKSSEGVEGRLNIRVKTIGGPRQHNGEMLVKGSCDEDLKMCRFELNCKRTPLLERETRDWTLKMNGEIVLPESPKTLKDLQEMRHKEIESKIQCQWGSEEKNEVTLRLQKTQSVEMSRLVKNAEFESKKGGLEQYEMLREASKLNKYNVLIEKDLSKQNELYIRRFLDIIKANFFFGGSVEPIRHEARRIKIEATIEPEDCRRVNFTIECNGEKLIVKEAYSPIRIPLYSIASRRPSLRSIGQRSSWTSVFMPTSECEVRSNKVDTFDGLVYKTPITTCYSVLAKDCSEQPEYAIMMKKVEKRGEEKKIKIVTPERKIECELKGERLVVKIDNREERDEEILREMGIEMLSESSCEITLPKLIVRFDGYKTEIKADKRTENTQCGLCGHFDGRRDNEFRRADNEETEDIEEFHRSWMSMDNECEVEEDKIKEKRNYGVESDEEERFDSRERSWSPFDSEEEMMESRSKKMLKKSLKKNVKNVDEEENTYKPEEKHIMIERESKTCFSMKKMPTCQPGDETYETKNKEIEFGCVPRSDRETRRIINALKRGENVNEEIINMSKTSKRITESLEVPTLCRVY